MASEKTKLSPPPVDYDPAAPLTDDEVKRLRPAREFFAERGIRMPVTRGRPRVELPKRAVTIRLDDDVVDFYKSDGPGWQTRINAALRETLPKKPA